MLLHKEQLIVSYEQRSGSESPLHTARGVMWLEWPARLVPDRPAESMLYHFLLKSPAIFSIVWFLGILILKNIVLAYEITFAISFEASVV